MASRMMNSAARSFTDWPGFMNSALPRISQPVASDARRRRISGVLPMASMTDDLTSMTSDFACAGEGLRVARKLAAGVAGFKVRTPTNRGKREKNASRKVGRRNSVSAAARLAHGLERSPARLASIAQTKTGVPGRTPVVSSLSPRAGPEADARLSPRYCGVVGSVAGGSAAGGSSRRRLRGRRFCGRGLSSRRFRSRGLGGRRLSRGRLCSRGFRGRRLSSGRLGSRRFPRPEAQWLPVAPQEEAVLPAAASRSNR